MLTGPQSARKLALATAAAAVLHLLTGCATDDLVQGLSASSIGKPADPAATTTAPGTASPAPTTGSAAPAPTAADPAKAPPATKVAP